MAYSKKDRTSTDSDLSVQVVTDTLLGLADWIGAGNAIRDAINEKNPNRKIIAKLENELQKAVSEKQITSEQLYDKLSKLENEGFNLSGMTQRIFGKAKQKVRNEYDEAKRAYDQIQDDSVIIQADLDTAKDVTSSARQLRSNDIVKDVETYLNGGNTNVQKETK